MDNYKYYTCTVAKDIFPIEWIYTKHIFYKTACYKEMPAYGIQQWFLTFTGLDS